ncbi:MAG: CRISPR-associated endonuclease Cas1 [Dissulfuribacterales bacterium]
MGILYLIEPQAIVHKEGGRFLVKKNGELLHSVHIAKLEQVIVAGPVMFTPAAIKTLLREGIDTIFSDNTGRYYGRLDGPESKNIFLRKSQFRRHDDEAFGLAFAKAVVRGKLRNQRVVLSRIQKNHKGVEITQPIAILSRLIERIDKAANLNELRGYEGQGAAIYFKAWGQGFKADGITFTSRQRRPPKDPVNALLSLGYTFLLHTVARAVNLAGIDPYLGFLHTVDYGRPSLVLDLMEEWRPVLIDTLVLSVFNLGVIKTDDFMECRGEDVEDGDDAASSEGRGIRLTSAGWRKFIAQYERRMADKVVFHLDGMEYSYRDVIMRQIRHFVQYLKGDVKDYTPFPIR